MQSPLRDTDFLTCILSFLDTIYKALNILISGSSPPTKEADEDVNNMPGNCLLK